MWAQQKIIKTKIILYFPGYFYTNQPSQLKFSLLRCFEWIANVDSKTLQFQYGKHNEIHCCKLEIKQLIINCSKPRRFCFLLKTNEAKPYKFKNSESQIEIYRFLRKKLLLHGIGLVFEYLNL